MSKTSPKRGSVLLPMLQSSSKSKHASQSQAINTLLSYLCKQEQVNADVLAICFAETPVYSSPDKQKEEDDLPALIETARSEKSTRLVMLSGFMGDKIEMLGQEQERVVKEITRVKLLLEKRSKGIRRLSVLALSAESEDGELNENDSDDDMMSEFFEMGLQFDQEMDLLISELEEHESISVDMLSNKNWQNMEHWNDAEGKISKNNEQRALQCWLLLYKIDFFFITFPLLYCSQTSI